VAGGDSLDLIELVMELEDEFKVTLSDQWCEKAFTNPRTMTLRQLALAIGELMDTTAAPSPQPTLLPTPVPERVPFLQMGGRASVTEWLDGPLYEVLGANRNGVTEYRRRTDGMRCIQLPAASVEPGTCDGSRGQRVPLPPFVIDVEPVANRAFARFHNSIGTIPPSILLEWFGTVVDDRRSTFFGLKRSGVTWAPLQNTDRQPVILVSWYGAAAYSLWAHRFDWRYYRGSNTIPSELKSVRVDAPPPRAGDQCLPSELEWEYAARGPQPQRYPWGDAEPTPELVRVAQHQAGRQYTAESLPVADVCDRLGMSVFGMHHMVGNVWQWCRDWYRSGSTPIAASEPTGIRSERGGSWVGPSRLAECGYRRGRPPEARGRCLGFRCVGGFDIMR